MRNAHPSWSGEPEWSVEEEGHLIINSIYLDSSKSGFVNSMIKPIWGSLEGD